MNLNQVTVSVQNIPKSKKFYALLGLRLIVDTDHYLRFECMEGDSTFSVHLSQEQFHSNPTTVYFETEKLDEEVTRLVDSGLTFDLMPTDQPWLWREARLKDPSGNPIILYFAGSNRKNPPWRVKH